MTENKNFFVVFEFFCIIIFFLNPCNQWIKNLEACICIKLKSSHNHNTNFNNEIHRNAELRTNNTEAVDAVPAVRVVVAPTR